MMRKRLSAITITLSAVLVAATGATAKVDPSTACTIQKVTASSAVLASLLKCQAQALKKGVTPDSACIEKVSTKLTATFAKAEAKAIKKGSACPTNGDASRFDDWLRSVADTIVFMASVPPVDPCEFVTCPLGTSCLAGRGVCVSDEQPQCGDLADACALDCPGGTVCTAVATAGGGECLCVAEEEPAPDPCEGRECPPGSSCLAPVPSVTICASDAQPECDPEPGFPACPIGTYPSYISLPPGTGYGDCFCVPCQEEGAPC